MPIEADKSRRILADDIQVWRERPVGRVVSTGLAQQLICRRPSGRRTDIVRHAMRNIDLHTLRVFDAIRRTGSLSRAADVMQVSQPAVSQCLGRLRAHFEDELFIRVGHSMRPTPQAEKLTPLIRDAITNLELTLSSKLNFDPAITQRSFRIAMTDIGQIVLLPRLLEHLGVAAPGARLDIVNITDNFHQLLESGEIDLVIGFVEALPDRLYQQTLFKEQFACLARSGHPRIGPRLTFAQYRAESHVLVLTSGTAHPSFESHLVSQNIVRKIAVRIPNFLALATIIAKSEYLCLLPRRAALIMARTESVTVWDLPMKLPQYPVKQHWHARQMRDPGHRWLRKTIGQLFA